mgnify:CR=1 FL=1
MATTTLGGNPVNTVGELPAVGSQAPAFSLVGLPDKAVSEARERVRAALQALSRALPAKRITSSLPATSFIATPRA